MRKTGTVIAMNKGRARVEIDSGAPTCCSCGNHGTSCNTLEAEAPSGLKTGDRVTLEVPSGPILRSIVMLLLIPACLLAGGVALGCVLIPAQPGEIKMGALLIGVVLMLAWYIAAHVIERHHPRAPQPAPSIIHFTTPADQAG
jgi:positive regulator of sigma E activity